MTSITTGPRAAKRGADQAAHSVWMTRLGRVGLGARGVLYILLAYLAIEVAFGQPNSGANKEGALQTVARQPFGHALLVVLAAGFSAYALWQLTMAAWGGSARAGSDKKGKRLAASVNGVVYGLLGASAIALAAGSSSRGSGNKAQTGLTGSIMQHSFGRPLIGVAGVAIIIIGVFQAWRALSGNHELELQPMSRAVRRQIETLAKIGRTARAVIVAAAGVFVIQAALTFDPNKTKGLDGILKSFAHTPVGPWLLVLVAGGVLSFGLYSLATARYAEL